MTSSITLRIAITAKLLVVHRSSGIMKYENAFFPTENG
jgi:hypothetical protein